LVATPTGTTTFRVALDATRTAVDLPTDTAPEPVITPASVDAPATPTFDAPIGATFTPDPHSAAPITTPAPETHATKTVSAPIGIGPIKVVTPSPFAVL